MRLVVIRKRKERMREKFKGSINIIWCWLYVASLELCQKLCWACDPGPTENGWAKDRGRNVWKETRSGPKAREKEKQETVYSVPLWGKWNHKYRLTSTTTATTSGPGIKPENLIPVIIAQSHPAYKQSLEQIPYFILELRKAYKKSLLPSPIRALMLCS